jgi:hypothetical protein
MFFYGVVAIQSPVTFQSGGRHPDKEPWFILF